MPIIPINSSVTTLSPESLSNEELLEYIESKRDESIQQSINARADILAVCEDEDASLQDAYKLYNDRTGNNLYVSERIEQSPEKTLGILFSASEEPQFSLDVKGYSQQEMLRIFEGKVDFSRKVIPPNQILVEMHYGNLVFDLRKSHEGGFLFSLEPDPSGVNADRLTEVMAFFSEFQAGNPNVDLYSELRKASAKSIRADTKTFDRLVYTANLVNDPEIRHGFKDDTAEALSIINEPGLNQDIREQVIDRLITSASNLPKTLVDFLSVIAQYSESDIDLNRLRTQYLKDRTEYVLTRAGDGFRILSQQADFGESTAIANGLPINRLHGVVDVRRSRPYEHASGMYGGDKNGPNRVFYQYKSLVALQCKYFPTDVDNPTMYGQYKDEQYMSFVDAKLMRAIADLYKQKTYSEGRSQGPILVRPSDIEVAYVPEAMKGSFPLESTDTPIVYY